jgi:hypothetical protein
MASQLPAESRWAADPERIDPDDYPSQDPFVKMMTWSPCPACDLQVHTPLTRFLLQGIVCPTCHVQLLAAPPDASEVLAQALRAEDQMSERLG